MVSYHWMLTGLTLAKDGVLEPMVKFEGTQVLNDNETVLTFNCSTTNMFLGCSVEYLINSRTYDDIRSINNTCQHKDGICQPDRCACSVECDAFVWNTTVQSDSINHTFGCVSRLSENGNIYKAKASLKWNGEDFITIPLSLDQVNVGLTTAFPEPNSFNKGMLILIVLCSCVVSMGGLAFGNIIWKLAKTKGNSTKRSDKTVDKTELKNDYGDTIQSSKISTISTNSQFSDIFNVTLRTDMAEETIPLSSLLTKPKNVSTCEEYSTTSV